MATAVTVKFLGENKNLLRSIDDSSSKLGRFASTAGRALRTAATGFGVLATGAVTAGPKILDAGNALQALAAKSQVVFGDSLGSVQAWADESARAMGLTSAQATGAAAAMGDLLKPMGFTEDQAASMSTQMLDLSGALSAWSGGQYDAAGVADILSKAMLGERDQLKALGISISAAEVAARLAANGQDKLTGAALQQAQALATQQLILEKSTDAQQGWADGTFDSIKASNAAKASIESIKETLLRGAVPALQAIIPPLSKLVDWVGERLPAAIETARGFVDQITEYWPRVTEVFSDTVDWLRSNWPYVVGAMSGIAVVLVSTVVPALVATAAAWIAAAAPVIAAAAAFAAIGVALVYAYQNVEWFRTAVDAVKEWMLNDLLPTVKAVWEGVRVSIQVALAAARVVIDNTVAVIQAVWSRFGDTILEYVTSTWNAIEKVISGALDIIMGVVDVFVGLLTGDWDKLWSGLGKIVDGALSVITGAAAAIWAAVKAGVKVGWDLVKTEVTDAVTALPGLILDGGAAMLRAGRGLLLRVRDGAIEALATAWNWISGWVTGLPGDIASLAGGVATAAYDMFKGFYDEAVEWLSKLPGIILDYVLGPLDEAWDKVTDFVSGVAGQLGGTDIDATAAGLSAEAKAAQDEANLLAAVAAARDVPGFADGGWVGRPFSAGRPVPAIVHEGEFVLSRNDVDQILRGAGEGRGSGPFIENFYVQDGRDIAAELDRLEVIHGVRYAT